MYQEISGCDNLSEPTIEKILDWTGRNPLLISILGYTIKLAPGTLDTLLSAENIADIPNGTLPEFKIPYDKQTQTLMGHTKEIYDKKFLNTYYKTHREYLKVLSCFSNAPVPRAFLSQIIPGFRDECLEECIDLGFIDISFQDTIQMPFLIAEAIRLSEKPRFKDLMPVIQNICYFLDYADVKLDIENLSYIFVPFIRYLQRTVKIQNNPNQKSVSTELESWWSFIYRCIEYYQRMGNSCDAEAIINTLLYPENMSSKRDSLSKEIFTFLNSWIEADRNPFMEKYDKIAYVLQTNDPYKILKNAPLFAYLTTMCLDRILLDLIDYSLRQPINELQYIQLQNTLY